MPASGNAEPPRGDPPGGLRLWRLLRRSLKLHRDKPAILASVAVGAIALFLLDLITGSLEPTPRNLAQAFAPAPLDVLGDINVTDFGDATWALAVTVVIRVTIVAVVLSLITGVRLTGRAVIRLSGSYAVAWVCFGVVFGMAGFYLRQLGRAAESAFSAGMVWAVLIVQPILLTAFVAILAPLTARAITGGRMRPRLTDGSIWGFAAVSVWLWAFVSPRFDNLSGSPYGAFALAFVVLAAQSVLLAGMAAATEESADLADAALHNS